MQVKEILMTMVIAIIAVGIALRVEPIRKIVGLPPMTATA